MQILRSALLTVVLKTSDFAVLVAGLDRTALGMHAIWALEGVFRSTMPPGDEHLVHFDEGILTATGGVYEKVLSQAASLPVTVDHQCDSRLVYGIQLADLAADHCSLLILEELGILTKTIKAGPNSGYDPNLDIELGWSVWAALRWHILNGGLPPVTEIISNDDLHAEMEGFGLFIARSCPDDVANAALRSRGRGYLGCRH